MNPYTVLGLSASASKSEAKAAYRKLAMEYHPDRGGNKARFQEIKEAWEWIERNESAPPATSNPAGEKPYKSSFNDSPGNTRKPPRPPPGFKPAPGYEAKGPRSLPKTYGVRDNRSTVFVVDLEVSPEHAFEGCTVPFVHKGVILDYVVRPGSSSKQVSEQFQMDEMIGGNRGLVSIKVNLLVVERPKPESTPKPEQKTVTADHHITYRICALGLFSGGKIEARDNLNEIVPISIQPGYNPAEPLIVKGKGYGIEGKRGDLHVTIEPVFKAPGTLSKVELKMLHRLNELAAAK